MLLCCLLLPLVGCRENSAPTVDVPLRSSTTTDLAPTPTQPTGAAEVEENELQTSDPTPSPPDPASLQLAGLRALESGEIDAAYDYARQAMRLKRDDPQVVFLMAMVLAERHRFPEAIEMLDEVAESTPDAKLPAMGHTADWLVRYGQWEQAEHRYRDILALVPQAAMAHRKLAGLMLRQGRRVEASSHLGELCHLGDVTENELRSMLMTLHPFVGDADEESFEPIGPLGFARTEIAREDWQSARRRLESLDSPSVWESALLARCLAVTGDMPALKEWVANADETVNVCPDAWFAKGIHADGMNESEDAARYFAESILLDPTDAEAYEQLAQSVDALQMNDRAESLRARADLIRQTQSIGMELARTDQRDLEQLLLLSELMRQLGRPLESLGWRGVWLTYADAAGSITETQTQEVLEGIVQSRNKLLEQNQTRASDEFVLCGLNLAELRKDP